MAFALHINTLMRGKETESRSLNAHFNSTKNLPFRDIVGKYKKFSFQVKSCSVIQSTSSNPPDHYPHNGEAARRSISIIYVN